MKDGGAAFPEIMWEYVNNDVVPYTIGGMTLRDYFAGQALAGCVGVRGMAISASRLADDAYEIADAMIAQREKKE